MKTSTWAKIAGWAQFGLQILSGAKSGGVPHGWAGWLTYAASLAAAIGIHGASNTSGTT